MTAKEAWTKLLKIFPFTKPSSDLFTEFCRVIDKFKPSIIEAACAHAVEHEVRFPAIALFNAYCYEFQEREEMERHKAQKDADKKTAEAIFRKEGYGRDEYSRACFANIKIALYGKITRKEFIENCKTLKLNVSQYLDYCDKWDLDLDNIIGAEYMHDFENTKGRRII